MHALDVKRNANNLKTIMRLTYFLSRQGLAFRGHNESINSHNRGNFLELLSLFSEYDTELKQHLLKNATASYTSATSQN